jgi:hypothetical protein
MSEDALIVRIDPPPQPPFPNHNNYPSTWSVAPPIEEIQAAFERNAVVKKVFTERIFNPKSMKFEVEHYVQLDNAEQAVYAVTLLHPLPNPRGRGYLGYTFSPPAQDTQSRSIYRAIGNCIEQIKEVDKKMVDLGAVPACEGFAVLPTKFMQKETFDSQIESLQSQIKANPKDKVLKCILHRTLVQHVKVDLKRRQEMLDALIDQRIALLVELHSFDRDAYPFTVDLEFGSV